MESRAKLFGHPIHPMLIVFPLGLLVTSLIFDVIYLITGNELMANVSFYMISAGIIGGLLAGIFGFIDYLALPNGTRARRIATYHGFGNLVVLLLFFFSWLIRRNIPGFLPDTLALVVSFAGVALGTITAWLGGELVDRLGVGVDPGANLNAPNSLTGQPASNVEAAHTLASPVPVTGDTVDRPIGEDIEVPTDEALPRDEPPRDKPLIDEP